MRTGAHAAVKINTQHSQRRSRTTSGGCANVAARTASGTSEGPLDEIESQILAETTTAGSDHIDFFRAGLSRSRFVVVPEFTAVTRRIRVLASRSCPARTSTRSWRNIPHNGSEIRSAAGSSSCSISNPGAQRRSTPIRIGQLPLHDDGTIGWSIWLRQEPRADSFGKLRSQFCIAGRSTRGVQAINQTIRQPASADAERTTGDPGLCRTLLPQGVPARSEDVRGR